MATLRAGALLARRYRLIDPIGAGGMSIIWRARDELLDRMVAIKVLTSELAADAKFRDLVREEARAAAQLVHPHVTAVHDYGEVVGNDGSITAFVVMELLSGEELEARLTTGPLPWQEAVEVCAQVAEALAAAHRLGIVHRDVTPANIMVTANGAKVLDFGIATHIGAPDEDEEGNTFGTPAYVAPERLDGVPAQPATDTYSLGVLLFETLSGSVPFPADTWDDLARAQPGGPMPPLEVPGLPGAVVEICRRCLSRDPRQRPTAYQVGDALREQLLPADPQATTMLSPTVTLPTLLPTWRAAGLGPVALAGFGATATLVGEGLGARPGHPSYGIGIATPPPIPTGLPSDGGFGFAGGPGTPAPPPPMPTGPPSDPRPPSDPGRRDHPPPPSRLDWTPIRAGLAAVGSVAALTASLLVGLNLGKAADRPTALQPTVVPFASAPGPVGDPVPSTAPTASVSKSAGTVTATTVPTPTRSVPTVRQAINALRDVVDDGIADGEIRRDAGIDLQQVINNVSLGVADNSVDLRSEVASLREKVAARSREGAVSKRYAGRLNRALDDLTIAR